jgi:tetratricopeptide (TPR) repeat protein
VLGLNGDELDSLEQLFGEFTAAAGLNGKAVFQKLRQGHSFGTALGLPEGTNALLYDRAYKWFAAGRPDKAEPLFRALCILDGEDANYQIGYAACLRRQGNTALARTAIDRAIALRPAWPVARFHAIELFAGLGDWTRVEEELHQFDALKGDDLPAQMAEEADRYRLALEMRKSSLESGARS